MKTGQIKNTWVEEAAQRLGENWASYGSAEEYLIDLNATRPRRIKDRRFLPSVYAFSTTGEWAKKCLEIMLPHKGCIGAFGHRISKETEEMIFAGMEWTIMHPIPTKVETD